MATRIQEILTRARDTLSDPNAERYTDERLLRLVDDAQKTIALQANLLRKKANIPLIEGQAEYDLPSDCRLITRVLRDSETPLELIGHENADRLYGDAWETEVGEVQSIIFDKLNNGIIKTYPIPGQIGSATWSPIAADAAVWNPVSFNQTNGIMVDSGYVRDTFNSDYGVVADIDYVSPFFTDENTCEGYTIVDDGTLSGEFGILVSLEDALWTFEDYDPLYGIVVGIEGYTLSGDYGVVAEFSSDLVNVYVNGVYGLLTGFSDESTGLTVYYLKKPNNITSIYDELEISTSFDRAIKFYVTGMALRDDRDTQNRAVGNEELQFFQIELQQADKAGRHDGTASRTQYNANYIGAFD